MQLQDSPYIRCIGFLYLRYGCDPKEIWEWVSPYIDDPEEFAPSSDPNVTTCVALLARARARARVCVCG